MAAPAYSSDLTDIVAPTFTTTGWTAFGGGASGLNAETDYYIIDSTCLSKNAWASDDKGMVYNAGSTSIPSGDAIFIWVTHLTSNSLAVESSGGIALCLGTGTAEGSFDRWNLAGSDTLVYDNRWLCGVVDPTETPDTSGAYSAPYSYFGASANLPSGGPSKGAPFAIGAIRYGREFQCTNGDLSNGYANFAGAATYDNNNTRQYGQIISSKGVYFVQGLFVMGTSTTAVDFRDSNKTIFIANTKKVPSTFNGFEVRNASSRVDWTNITLTALGTQSPGSFTATDNADINLSGCNFVGLGDFDLLAGSAATDCSWRDCGQITAPGSDLSNSSVSGYAGTADTSALVWDVATNPNTLLEGMTFTDGTGNNTHAIEFGTSIPPAITLNNMTFNDYGADSTNNAALNFLDNSGTITVTLTNTTQPTYKTAGATITFVTNAVTVTAKAQTTDGTAIQSARVFLEKSSGTGAFPHLDTVTISNSGTTATVTHTAHGLATNDKVVIRGGNIQANRGVFTITVTNANTYTYTMGSSPGASPTGTITSTFVFLDGTTDVNGEISMTRSFPAAQSASGWARKSSAAPYYKQGRMNGDVSNTVNTSFTAVLVSDD